MASEGNTNGKPHPWRFWAWPWELRRRGILGINERNAQYVLAHNPRHYFPRVDDKLKTKEICRQFRIPVPQTYGVVERHGDIRRFARLVARHGEFVIKPAKGAEGRGIIVVTSHDGERFTTAGGESLAVADVTYHLAAIMAGLYSLGGQPDRAIIEQRIVKHPIFERIAVGGTPDIRVVMYRTVPVMAMVRLPTRASRGRANLHQGAVAAGVHLTTGQTSGGVCQGRAVEAHPDSGEKLAGHTIPQWEKLLSCATRLAEGLELGYIGVDFVLDAQAGPVVLEANARPGLAIQIANRRGIYHRLRLLDAQPAEMLRPDRRAELLARLAAVE